MHNSDMHAHCTAPSPTPSGGQPPQPPTAGGVSREKGEERRSGVGGDEGRVSGNGRWETGYGRCEIGERGRGDGWGSGKGRRIETEKEKIAKNASYDFVRTAYYDVKSI